METYSKTIAAAYAQFMRTGDPSTAANPWPAFTNAQRLTMIYDQTFHMATDPLKEEREVLLGQGEEPVLINTFRERGSLSFGNVM